MPLQDKGQGVGAEAPEAATEVQLDKELLGAKPDHREEDNVSKGTKVDTIQTKIKNQNNCNKTGMSKITLTHLRQLPFTHKA